MAWFDNLFNNRFKLTDRNLIFKLFGSFDANKIGTDPNRQIQRGFEGNVDVYSVVSKIVETLKAVPTVIERRTRNGWEVIEDTSIHELMAAPNVGKGYTWDDIEEQRGVYLLASGDNFMVGATQFERTLIEEVDILPAPSVDIQSTPDFFMPELQYDFSLGTTRRTFTNEQVQHVKNFNPGYDSVQQSFRGLSIIQVAQSVVRVGNARWNAHASLVENKGALGLLTDKSDRPMTPAEAEQAQSGIDARIAGVNNQGKVIVTNKDLNFVKMAMSPADLQLVESGVITLRAICNLYGLDSSLFNDPANKTFNNRKEAEKALYTNVVQPLANKIDAADTMFIAKNHFPDGSVRMRKDFSTVDALQTDKRTEAQKDKIKMDGVSVVLNMPISNDAKMRLLVSEYEFTSEEAAAIVAPVGQGNVQLDILGSLSPLLANKIIEKLSDEEIRRLLNL